jgi:transcriptional regulator with XRE-family HTH domain
MQLIDWFKKYGYSQKEVAAAVGLSETKLSRICSGKLNPRLSEVLALEDFTNKKVMARDWLDRMRQTKQQLKGDCDEKSIERQGNE